MELAICHIVMSVGGIFRMDINPVDELLVNDYVVKEEISSVVLPHIIIKVYYFHCPNCDVEIPRPEHGKLSRCPYCELYMKSWGNQLLVSWQEILN